MEPMRIEIEALALRKKWVYCRARASAPDANIRLVVRFCRPELATTPEIRELARDEVLRYLDPA